MVETQTLEKMSPARGVDEEDGWWSVLENKSCFKKSLFINVEGGEVRVDGERDVRANGDGDAEQKPKSPICARY